MTDQCSNVLPEEDGMGSVSSVGEPPQNIPQSVGKNSEAREPYIDVPLYGFHGVKPPPYEVPNQYEKNRRERERDIRDARRLVVEERTMRIGGVGLFALLFTLCASIEQARIARETFQATRRAVVHLVIQDGKIGDFFPGNDVLRIILYFSNSGPTTAQRTVTDIWPITTIPDQPPVVTKFLPPNPRSSGPNIPPGFPYTLYSPYHDATQEELDSGVKELQIIGRITYADVFGRHCETFALNYNLVPLSQFRLTASDGPELCDKEEDTIESGSVTVRPGPAIQNFPFPGPPRQNTKDTLQ